MVSTTPLTAVIYARVSSARQAEDGLPIASQVEQCRRKAEALGAQVVREFLDEGISGRTAQGRPEFMKAIAFCQEFKVGYFIVWNSARFARNKIEAAQFKRLLRARGVNVAYVSNNIDPATDEGWLSESVMEMMDEFYSRSLSKDTRRSMIKNAADGFFNGGRVPYGYRVVQEGRRRRLAIDELEAPLIRRIFKTYAHEGVGFREIAVRLNQDGFTKRGEKWNKKGIGLILQNHRYIGVSIFNREDHQERTMRDPSEWVRAQSHEAIVDVDTFNLVQQIIRERAPEKDHSSPRSSWLFTGIACCGLCGARMKIETATGRSKTYAYYRCSSAIAGTGCPGFRVRAQDLDDFFMAEVIDRVFTQEHLQSIADWLNSERSSEDLADERSETRALLVAELRDVENKRQKIFDVLEAHGKDAPGLEDLVDRAAKYRDRVNEIEGALFNLEAVEELDKEPIEPADVDRVGQMVADVMSWDAENDPASLRGFLRYLLQRIDVKPDGAHLTYYPERLFTMNQPVQSKGRWLPVRRLLRTAELELPPPPAASRRVA